MGELSNTVGRLTAAHRAELSRSDWRRLNQLLEQALELEPGQREGWRRALPESDAALWPLMEQLLARTAVDGPGGPAVLPLHGVALSQALRVTATQGAEAPGTQIGPYRLLSELGVGGMGSVWLAERTDGTYQRQVALKLPRAEWTDRGLSERMARERAVLASLNHPNIAQMYEAGWATDGRPYLALEYVDGEPIDAWCKSRSLTTTARVRLFVDVVRAVAFAHAKLVIHRDIKPSNVLITTEGRVKLLDFGIAKLLSAEEMTADATALTQLSGRALTLNYAAPEQILGQPVSTAADTYSLGVMFFELLTGSRPYRPARDSRGALEEVIVNTDPPLPSSVAADKTAARALRGDLDAIVLKALRKKPEQRYETAAAFADDMERWLDQRPVRAQRGSGWYRARRFVGRHQLRFVAGTMAMLAVLVGGSVILWQRHVAGEDAARATSVRNFVLAIIAQADPMASGATRDADLALLTTAESRLTDELAKHPELALELRVAIARAYRNRGEFQRAREALLRAITAARQVLPASDPRLARAWIEATEWRLAWRPEDHVDPEIDRAIEAMRQLGREGAESAIEGLRLRSWRQGVRGDLQAMIADLREAHALAVKYFGEGDLRSLRTAVGLQAVLFDEPVAKRLEVTDRAYRAALVKVGLPHSDPVFLDVQRRHGENLCEAGRGREGLELAHSAVDTARKQHGGGIVTERALESLSNCLLVTGDAGGMFEIAREMYAMASAREPPGSFNRSVKANSLLYAALVSRRVDGIALVVSEAAQFKSTADWHQAMLVWLKIFEGDTVGAAGLAPSAIEVASREGWTWWVTVARLGWSYALRQNGQQEEAQRTLEPLAHVSEADVLEERAAVQLALGDAASALATAETSIGRLSLTRLRTDPRLSDLQLTRGQALLQLGRAEEALAAFRVAEDFWRGYDPTSHWSAEASYWLAHALIETGDATTGRPMLKAARARLAKSPMPLHRRLAAMTDVAGYSFNRVSATGPGPRP
jgi:serine/threonine-protein kinase